jgi:hypothetical protein
MREHDYENDTTTQSPQLDHDSTHPSASSSTANDTPATTSTSENLDKTSGRWTENEIKLLLDYVEENCTLTTARGLNLKKSEFNQAHATVKSKDANQCHYKWGHVHILFFYH